MTKSDKKRLDSIRKQSKKWIKKNPEAKNWNDSFLLGIIDELMKKEK